MNFSIAAFTKMEVSAGLLSCYNIYSLEIVLGEVDLERLTSDLRTANMTGRFAKSRETNI